MKRSLLSLATAVALLTTSVAANAVTFPYYYDKNSKRVCLVHTGEFTDTPRMYWSAIKPNGKCDGTEFSPLGGPMNIRFRKDLGGNFWAQLQQAARIKGVVLDSSSSVYCRQYQGTGSKIRWNFVVTDTTGEEVSSGWREDAGTKCVYPVPMNNH